MAFLDPMTLRGSLVVLEPLTVEHDEALIDAAADGELWTLAYTGVPRPEDMRSVVEDYLARQDAGTMLPLVVRRCSDRQIVGMTTFCHPDSRSRRVEIGYTWLARSVQRSGINAENKLLMLSHAFDELDCIAVEFRTHWLNHQSRRAIERLGAKQDGVLRSHMIMPNGTVRDTVVFSIIAVEWPAVRAELHRRLEVG